MLKVQTQATNLVYLVFLDSTEFKTALTSCGGEGSRARATGIDRRQGWHVGAGAVTGG